MREWRGFQGGRHKEGQKPGGGREQRICCGCVLRRQDIRAEVGGGWEDPSRKGRGSWLGFGAAESKRWGGLWEAVGEK